MHVQYENGTLEIAEAIRRLQSGLHPDTNALPRDTSPLLTFSSPLRYVPV